MKKADVYISRITITTNTHDLLGVPSEKSQKKFFDAVWNMSIDGWEMQSSEQVHYVVFQFVFNVVDNKLDGIETVRAEIQKLTSLLKPIK